MNSASTSTPSATVSFLSAIRRTTHRCSSISPTRSAWPMCAGSPNASPACRRMSLRGSRGLGSPSWLHICSPRADPGASDARRERPVQEVACAGGLFRQRDQPGHVDLLDRALQRCGIDAVAAHRDIETLDQDDADLAVFRAAIVALVDDL